MPKPAVRPDTLTLSQALTYATSTYGHARSCKASPDTCKVCQGVIAWYRLLPLARLAEVLQDCPRRHGGGV